MENFYNKVIKIKYDIYKKNKLFQYNSFIDENLKYMGLSGVDKNGKLRKLYKPPTDPSELTKDIGTYIWNIDPNVIPHLREYESDEGLYRFKETNEQIPSLQFIPIKDLDQKTINDVQTWKKDISEVVSPTQLKELKDSVEGLKTFKTVSTTVWIVVQTIFGLAITLYSIFK